MFSPKRVNLVFPLFKVSVFNKNTTELVFQRRKGQNHMNTRVNGIMIDISTLVEISILAWIEENIH